MNPAPGAGSGARSEVAALAFLQRSGLRLVERNYRCRRGEIDLIMRHGDTLVFVEVRMRSNAGYGGALESIDARKQARILYTAEQYLLSHAEQAGRACRFDVVTVAGSSGQAEMQWIRDAFRE